MNGMAEDHIRVFNLCVQLVTRWVRIPRIFLLMEQGDDTNEDDDDETGDDGNSQVTMNNSAAVSNQTQQHSDATPATVPAEPQDCEDSRVALVPCGHARFCLACANTVTNLGQSCPICRSTIHMVLRIF